MSRDTEIALTNAHEYARLASATAAGLKHGSYDAVKALAMTSSAHSLAVLAQQAADRES
jgi:hypothetical protein